MGLTPAEFDAWHDLTTTDDMLEFEIAMDAIIAEAGHQAEPEGECSCENDDDEDLAFEVIIPMGQAESTYEAWWAFMAGNALAWNSLVDPLTEVFDSLGWALFGTDVDDDLLEGD